MAALRDLFVGYSVSKFRQLDERLEICVARLTPEQVWARGHETNNAVGNLVLHLNGNVRQWIVSALGGAPDLRQRDAEFAARDGAEISVLVAQLRATVDEAIAVIESCDEAMLETIHKVQNREFSGLEVIYHVVEHFSMHTGQIMFLTKMLTGEDLGFYTNLQTKPAST